MFSADVCRPAATPIQAYGDHADAPAPSLCTDSDKYPSVKCPPESSSWTQPKLRESILYNLFQPSCRSSGGVRPR